MKSQFRHRVGVGLVALATLATISVTTAPPASAAISCSTGKSADLHSAWAYCSSNQPTTGRFRVKANFCVAHGCNLVYGPWKFVDQGQRSTVSNSGAYVQSVSSEQAGGA
ncbi:hypothetical protein Misp02_64090 [Microtetraspora sp. NBRC 16547]|nr:hypothetical protein Misp02_64090 [Microtetraspora sp. NBRC 16547]